MADAAQNKRTLIVEDDVFLQKILVTKLTKEGFAVEAVSDGEAALASVRANPPAFVLLDLIIPKVDGFDVLYAMKTDPKLKGIPVIVLSNLAQDEDKKRALDLGAVEYLVKGDLAINDVVRKVKETYAKLLPG